MHTLDFFSTRAIFMTTMLLIVSQTNADTAISVEDFHGRLVHLEKPATRIVALAPHIVENVFSAGAGGKLVGAVDYSNYPEEAKAIKRIGSSHSWSLESLIALEPDLVIVWGSGNGTDRLLFLERLGIPVFVSELRELDDISASIKAIGTLAGTSETSETVSLHLKRDFSRLARDYSQDLPVSVFYQIWNDPLQTINGKHLISQVIQLCGGRNIFDEARTLAPKVSIESVLNRNPDAIVASGMDTARPEWLDEWRKYPSLRAVQRNTLVFIPPDYIQRPTARIALGARMLCHQLHAVRVDIQKSS